MLYTSPIGDILELYRVVRSTERGDVVQRRVQHVLAEQIVAATLQAEIHKVRVYISRRAAGAERSGEMQWHPDRAGRTQTGDIRDLQQGVTLRKVVQQDKRAAVIGELGAGR